MEHLIEKYNRDGYVIVTDFLSDTEHQLLNGVCDKLTERAMSLTHDQDGWILNSPNNPCKLDGAMAKIPEFGDLGRNPTLVSIAKEILGQTEIDMYISKFFPMVPKHGFSVHWHQDNFYIKGDPSKMVSCDVFLNGATKENGCLRILKNSHKQEHPHIINTHSVFSWMKVEESDDIIDIELDKPFAIFFDVDLVHGCYRNTSDSDFRYSIAWEYKERGYLPKTFNNHVSQDVITI